MFSNGLDIVLADFLTFGDPFNYIKQSLVIPLGVLSKLRLVGQSIVLGVFLVISLAKFLESVISGDGLNKLIYRGEGRALPISSFVGNSSEE